MTIDLHAPQIEGFFHIPVDSWTAVPTLCQAVQPHLPADVVVVSPDAGRVPMATEYARRLGTTVVVIHKQWMSGTETAITHLVGDVRDRPCLIIDDMIATGGTIAESVEALIDADARPEITVAATHGLFLEGARERLTHPAIREVIVTNTMPIAPTQWDHLRVISVAPLIAGAIQCFLADGSLSDLGG